MTGEKLTLLDFVLIVTAVIILKSDMSMLAIQNDVRLDSSLFICVDDSLLCSVGWSLIWPCRAMI